MTKVNNVISETALAATEKRHIKINKRLNRQKDPSGRSKLKQEIEGIRCKLSMLDEIPRNSNISKRESKKMKENKAEI